MNVEELEDILSSKNIKIPNSDIARLWGIDASSYSRKKRQGTEIALKNLVKLEKQFNINLITTDNFSDNSNNENNIITFSPLVASCGTGVMNVDIDYLELDKKKKYCYVFAVGDSMTPTIMDNDLLFVQLNDCIDKSNAIYCFTYGNEQYIKRLSTNINEVVISSDNSNKYHDIVLKGDELNKLRIIGRVIGSVKKF